MAKTADVTSHQPYQAPASGATTLDSQKAYDFFSAALVARNEIKSGPDRQKSVWGACVWARRKTLLFRALMQSGITSSKLLKSRYQPQPVHPRDQTHLGGAIQVEIVVEYWTHRSWRQLRASGTRWIRKSATDRGLRRDLDSMTGPKDRIGNQRHVVRRRRSNHTIEGLPSAVMWLCARYAVRNP
jgi:hypothetical protein